MYGRWQLSCPGQAGIRSRPLPSGLRCSETTSWSTGTLMPPTASTSFVNPPKLITAPASNRRMPVTLPTVRASSSKPCAGLYLRSPIRLPSAIAALIFARCAGLPDAANAGICTTRSRGTENR